MKNVNFGIGCLKWKIAAVEDRTRVRTVLQRTDSNKDREHCGEEKDSRKNCSKTVDRSWSGNLGPAAYEEIRSEPLMSVAPRKKIKKGGHRRLNTIDTTYGAEGEPRLVRSCGMRRDWSFENLREERDEKMRKEMRARRRL
ncbi:uncharacterized protein LOC111276252 isoform X3 [Durio zibethinus]|nr:uncharacterized protein LOC111276252 isoform X3 [Durio zibethinus]XP_022717783.1 uncharacterized protein LOC111276252 isoform X3 [Durio zibethinus]